MSVVEKQMIGHDDDDNESDEHNNQIVISTQVNVDETTNAVRTIAVQNPHQQQRQQQKHQQHHQQQKHQSIHTKNLSVARHLRDNEEHEEEENDNSEIPDNSYCTFTQETQRRFFCLSRVLQIIFSTPGLVVLVVIYSIMGALIFPLLEVPQDITQSSEIVKSREECLRELWSITGEFKKRLC